MTSAKLTEEEEPSSPPSEPSSAATETQELETQELETQEPETQEPETQEPPPDVEAEPKTPRKASAPDGGAPSKSTPSDGRPRTAHAKPPPSLWNDFLLGRPSPARIAANQEAARKRRQSLDMVKQEMRQAAVQRVQAPGGVRDRVKKWQAENAAAMAAADPLAPPSEPSDVHIQVKPESVTESDRQRIRSREKEKAPKVVVVKQATAKGGVRNAQQNQKEKVDNNPPKKRVVSDTNWMKKKNASNKKSPPRNRSPKGKQNKAPLKGPVLRPGTSPAMSKKIREWANQVEIPDDTPSKRHLTSKSVGDLDGIRVTPASSESGSSSDSGSSLSTHIIIGTESEPAKQKPTTLPDDGIRVKAIRKQNVTDDGIRVRPSSSARDDGIRVYTNRAGSESGSTTRLQYRKGSRDTRTPSRSARREKSPSVHSEAIEAPDVDEPQTPTRRATGRPRNTQRKAASKPAADTATTVTGTEVTETTGTGTTVTDTTRTGTTVTEQTSGQDGQWSDAQSGRVPSPPGKSLADIPVGYSAFSELDLPRGSKNQRQASFKGATNVLKKAFTEGKKIIAEKVEPPKPVANKPPNIENWLQGTVDPFVEVEDSSSISDPEDPSTIADERSETVDPNEPHSEPSNKKAPAKKTRPISEPTEVSAFTEDFNQSEVTATTGTTATTDVTGTTGTTETTETSGTTATVTTSSTLTKEPSVKKQAPRSASQGTSSGSASLKRSRATRASASPVKNGPKKGFKDLIRDAFRGESTGHKVSPPVEYPSGTELLEEEPYEPSYAPRQSSRSRSPYSSDDDDDSYSSVSDDSALTPKPLNIKRRPPTNGQNQLSTIISEGETCSTCVSDQTSMVSQTVVTGLTGTTGTSAYTGTSGYTGTSTGTSRYTGSSAGTSRYTGTQVSRQRSNKSGLKRRLTNHSDLVSVLSLPDDGPTPGRKGSIRSAHLSRRSSNRLNNASVESLLREFATDENLFQRELKTLVDGVVPVLLTQVVHGDGRASADLFGPSTGKSKEDALSKAVVNMGISLEKLRNAHRRCPLGDVHRLPQWLEWVHAIYDGYLDVWRIGFQGIVVNLAPASPDDEDSLVNAMPRNEEGDVLDEDGHRIDVAHLLKRPLVRIKWITKFIKGYRTITGTDRYETLEVRWENLQDKARKRNKEESARAIDEDAINTDTTRTRDLRTLEAMEHVRIDRFRQVLAKDMFSLDLRHSSGQRLGCQVELVFRDNQLFKSDAGDLLVRETGSQGRSWLLFGPVTGSYCSARKGDHDCQLVVMIRGRQDAWFELLILTADSEEQIEDWLDILGSVPMPPAIRDVEHDMERSLSRSQKSGSRDAPLGRRQRRVSPIAPIPERATESPEPSPRATSHHHTRTASSPSVPMATPTRKRSSPSPETTPTQHSRSKSRSPSNGSSDGYSQHSQEDAQSDTAGSQKSPNSTPFRKDGAPPPPVHRSLGPKESPKLSPPSSNRVKRRQSSPLKHEYTPSEMSSEGSMTVTESDGDSDITVSDESSEEYSEDELEAADMPDTMPAISIKHHDHHEYHDHHGRHEHLDTIAESVVYQQEAQEDIVQEIPEEPSVPPPSPPAAAVAQQASQQPDYIFMSIASISYWDDKQGTWKDLWPDVCSITTTPGLIEAYPFRRTHTSSGDVPQEDEKPLLALDLTPLVMLRNSTVLDLEIRSPVLDYSRVYPKVSKTDSSFFRFRSANYQDCESLYLAAHRARMDNAKYKALEEEARIRAFGQNQAAEADEGGTRKRWFGRKNSYRASARAPSQSAGSAAQSTASASSFLKRLVGGNQSYNIAMSSVDRENQGNSPEGSLYAPSFSLRSSPRSPSISIAHSSNYKRNLTTNNLKIRLHLLITASKWEDYGNCVLEVTRPDTGVRQNLRKYQGMEKRVIVKTVPKKNPSKSVVMLDVVLGSRCFSRMGSRGVLLNVWEEVKGADGQAGVAPMQRGSGGNVSKWCFQCASVGEASWIFGLVTQEVFIG